MNPDSVKVSSSIPEGYGGPGIRNSRTPQDARRGAGATTPLPTPAKRPRDPGKALYGLRVDFDSGIVTRLYIVFDTTPKKPRKKFRKKTVDPSGEG